MRWYILDESARPRVGNFVAVAVTFNELEATLIRDYLRERHIPAHTPPSSISHPPLERIYVWVPAAKQQEVVALLERLAAEWQEELSDEGE
ncbi:MAG: hypothetical protein NZL85_07905 [Fimbriimonadales bacterium]|nr:hypothetical protein [Fimbriimonadales bacterium]